MAAHEGDSSDDDGDYTTTNVVLGYASKEPTDDQFSQMGDLAQRRASIILACQMQNLQFLYDLTPSIEWRSARSASGP
ncbi:MAG: hypothetical protein Q9203_007612 [Teloschistes exilis]